MRQIFVCMDCDLPMSVFKEISISFEGHFYDGNRENERVGRTLA